VKRCTLLAIGLLLLVSSAFAGEGQWSRFRGPNGTGISDATTVPVQWTEKDYNWKVEIPGVGHSSPVVWKDRIYLTSGDRKTATRSILCLNTADGRKRWQRDYPSKTYRQHGANSYMSATPAADARGVVVTWTTPEEVVLLALSQDGEKLWRRSLGPFVGARGSAVSPIIFNDLVVLPNDQEDPNQLPENFGKPRIDRIGKSFLIAVNRTTGQTRWKLDRRTGIASYSVPCVYRPEGGAAELIFTSTAHGITSVNPTTGKVNWELAGVLPSRVVGSPVFAAGLIFAAHGRGVVGTSLVAVQPGTLREDGKPKLVYEVKTAVPLVPTPVVKGGRLFLWGDGGVVSCLNASDGKVIWRQRAGGSVYSSPVCVNDRLYCADRKGEVVVLAAADKFEILSRVPPGEPCYATPAVAGGVIYFRTHSHLLSLGGKGG